MPHTASPSPLRVTTPLRASAPQRTSATSETRTTPVGWEATTMARMSSWVWMRPSARTSSASSPSRTRPAPSFRLFCDSASASIAEVMPRAAIAAGSGATS